MYSESFNVFNVVKLVKLQEKPCLLILILDSVVVGNSWQGEHDSKEIEQ